ncbi:MAG: LytR C-terminal domain-containing protein [Betaproteobacteria bacterium]|nr:MAG: LytR C-terminal domain-containing protein [Betaproteobacteria bacterium]
MKLALLASAAMLASGCSADWPRQNLAYRLDQRSAIEAADNYQLGKRQFASGLYGMALKSFRTALAKEPGSVDFLNAVAATYDKLGRFDLSERYYARAIAIDPRSVPTLNNVGYSFLLQEDYVSARRYLEQAATVAATDSKYKTIVGENLISLETAENGAMAGLPRPVESGAAATLAEMVPQSPREIIAGTRHGQEYAAAVPFDAAGSGTAAIAMEEVRHDKASGGPLGEPVLIHAALSMPMVEAAPVIAVKAETLPAPIGTPVGEKLALTAEVSIEVSNGNGRRHMAARTRQFLKDQGIRVSRITNARHFGFATSTVFYREGYADKAREISNLFPVPMEFRLVKEQPADIRLLFGRDALDFDSQRLVAKGGV